MLLAFSGERFSGKDAAAKYLVVKHGFIHLKFAGKLKRAVEILFDLPDDWSWETDKESPCALFKGYSKRQVLQGYGTDGLPSELWTQFRMDRHLDPIIRVLFDIPEHVDLELTKMLAPYKVADVVMTIAKGGFRDNLDQQFWGNVAIPRAIREKSEWWLTHNIVFSDARFKNEVFDVIWENNGYLFYVERPGVKGVATKHASESNLDWLKARSDFFLLNRGTLESYHEILEDLYGVIKAREAIADRGRKEGFAPSFKTTIDWLV